MPQYVMSMLRVSKIVPPKRQIIKDISLSFFAGAKIGLLGLNGAGKSTVLRLMAGVDEEYDGEVQRQSGIRIGYLPQEPRLEAASTVRQEVESAQGDVAAALARLEQVYAAYGDPDADMEKLAEEQARLEAVIANAGADTGTALEIAADALRLPPWEARVEHLSGGEKRRVALCKLLLSKPDMLLLDEPTNHLDAESVEWLEQYLGRFPGTVVAVTHDRYFLDNVAEWILELDRGHGIPWKGNYSSWLEQKEARLELEAKQETARIRAMKQELEWVRQNPKARQAKSKARLARFEELSTYEVQKRNETQEIFIPVAERLGQKVIEFRNVSKGFGDRLLIDDLSFIVPPGATVGIIGPNGAGKSTLFKMITGQEKPNQGSVELGPSVKLAFVDQSRERLSGDKTVFEEISGGDDLITVGKFEMPSRAYMRPLQLQGGRPAEAGGDALRRRARPAAPRQDPHDGRQRPAAGRALQRPRRGDAPGAGGRAAGVCRRACWSSRTTAGSWTASPPTSWRPKATPAGRSSPATTRSTRPTSGVGWARKGPSPGGSGTSRSRGSGFTAHTPGPWSRDQVGAVPPRADRGGRYNCRMQRSIERRTFLKLSSASAAGVLVGSLGCAGSGAARPVVSTSGAGRFLYFDADDAILELRPWQHRLLVTRSSGKTTVIGGVGSGAGQLNAPAALAVGSDGLVYVADRGNHRVQVFTLGGSLVRSFGSYGAGDGELSYPAGIGFDAAGRVLVSDTRNHRIAVYHPSGTLQGYAVQGSGGVSLQGPLTVAPGAGNTIHVVDAGNARVQVFDLDLSPLFTYGGYGVGGGRMVLPEALAIDGEGTAYVGDVTASSLLAFDRDGIFRERLALEGAPAHLAIAPDGTLYVTGCSPV